MACALELRLYLERGALLASQQAARSLVAQVRPLASPPERAPGVV